MTQPMYAVAAAIEPGKPDDGCLRQEPVVCGGLMAEAFSLRGLSHARSGEPLQDSCALSALPNGWLLAVVADGVGSEPRSEVGSAIAARSVAAFLSRYWGKAEDEAGVLALLRTAYNHAYGCLAVRAQMEHRSMHDFGTTLHTAIFTGQRVYYGHAGDGGLLVMDSRGGFRNCTEPQKGPDGESVMTLLAGPESWQFGAVDDAVSAMLLTDGVYDKLASRMLKRFGSGVDRGLAACFMSPWAFDFRAGRPEADRDEMISAFRTATPNDFYPRMARAVAQGGDEGAAQRFVAEHLLQGNRPLRLLQEIQDDISVAVLRNLARLPEPCPQDDFLPPDWDAINRRISAELYGGGASKAGDKPDQETKQPPMAGTDPIIGAEPTVGTGPETRTNATNNINDREAVERHADDQGS